MTVYECKRYWVRLILGVSSLNERNYGNNLTAGRKEGVLYEDGNKGVYHSLVTVAKVVNTFSWSSAGG